MPIFIRENIKFNFLDRGKGVPVILQHGLGGDSEKIFSLVNLPAGFRLLGMDCRAHGATEPIGPAEKLGFNAFGDDLISLLDHLQIEAAVVGGTSMGAGVALNCALRHGQRVRGLILLRPAWLERPNQANIELFDCVAGLLKKHGPERGQQLFRASELYISIARQSPDSAESLLGLFVAPDALQRVARLERIPRDAPHAARDDYKRLALPTLIMATAGDPIHPFEYGRILASEIPAARLKQLTSKSASLEQYTQDLNGCLADFLQSHFL